MGSVSGLKSFLTLVDWEGLGEGDRNILSLREKSSGSMSRVGRDTTTYFCLRREDGDCREETDATGLGFGYKIAAWISDLYLGRFAACCTGMGWVEFTKFNFVSEVSGLIEPNSSSWERAPHGAKSNPRSYYYSNIIYSESLVSHLQVRSPKSIVSFFILFRISYFTKLLTLACSRFILFYSFSCQCTKMIFYKIQIDDVLRTKVQEKADEGRATMIAKDGLEMRTHLEPQVCFFFCFLLLTS
jgi:hypothetical protein